MDVWALMFLPAHHRFYLWFPIKLMRNAAVYTLGFIIYFSSRSAGLLAVNLLPHRYLKKVDPAMLAVSLGCLLFWVAALRRRMQIAPVSLAICGTRPRSDD